MNSTQLANTTTSTKQSTWTCIALSAKGPTKYKRHSTVAVVRSQNLPSGWLISFVGGASDHKRKLCTSYNNIAAHKQEGFRVQSFHSLDE